MKNALAFSQVVGQQTLFHEGAHTLNPEDTYYPRKQVKRGRPVILPKKVQLLTLGCIPNLQQS